MARKCLSTTQAAVVQLLAPIVPTIGGVIFAREVFYLRRAVSCIKILCGMLAVMLGSQYSIQSVQEKAERNKEIKVSRNYGGWPL
tara:strand:+ start:318 stop:572 length:255 start_codon:yes stop_codon:yes gene_type:complete